MHYAKKITQDIVAKTDVMDELPRLVEVVSEVGNDVIQELSGYSHRIIYENTDQGVVVLAVTEKLRDLQPERIER